MSGPKGRAREQKRARRRRREVVRRARVEPNRTKPRRIGRAGTSRADWRDWREVAETFTAERPCADRAVVEHIVELALAGVTDWPALLSGHWVRLAALRVDDFCELPGHGHASVHRILDRFVDWLFARGDLDAWQRDVLWTAIDDSRVARGRPAQRAKRVSELVLREHEQARLGERFAATLEEPQRERARRIPRILAFHLEWQLGDSSFAPLGSLDPEEAILMCVLVAEGEEEEELVRSDLALASSFYRWLGQTGQLEPTHADSIAARLAAGALSIARRSPSSEPRATS